MLETIASEVFFYGKRDTCSPDNDYNGEHWGARISAVFVILITSALGTFFPVLSSRYSFIKMPWYCFFVAKYFGSGVIIATAFIHLLQPANESLSDECLTGVFQAYPIAFAIALITLFVLFFIELVAYRLVDKKVAKMMGESAENDAGHTHSHFGDESVFVQKAKEDDDEEDDSVVAKNEKSEVKTDLYPSHFSHAKDHQDLENINTPVNDKEKEQYYGQLLSVFVLEFGVVFHSVFVGLALSVSGEEFVSLYIVIVFHQMFEGLGLGSRIAIAPWPKEKRWTPWLLCLAYTLTTPIAIAIGLGVRTSYPPGSRRALITNGVFDSISAGILLYAGIVELMAHEFLYSDEFKGDKGFIRMLWAYFVMCWGCGLMALLGKWA